MQGAASDRSFRRQCIAALIFCLSGSCAFVVGLRDVGFSTEPSSRGLGLALALAGALLSVSGLLLFKGKSPATYALSLVASVSGAFLSVLLGLVQLATGDLVLAFETGSVLTFLLWPVLMGAFVWIGLRARAAGGGHALVKDKDAMLTASVASLGAIVTLGQFVYSSLYLPSTAPPSLAFDLAVTQVGRNLQTNVTIRNTSTTGITALGSLYYVAVPRVLVTRATKETAKLATFRQRLAKPAFADLPLGGPVAERYGKQKKEVVAEAGTLMPQDARLEAGGQTSRRFVVRVSRRRGGPREARLVVFISFARGGGVKLKRPPMKQPPGQDGADTTKSVTRAELAESSWIRRFVRNQRYVERTWEVTPAGSPRVATAIDVGPVRDSSTDEKTRTRMETLYGLGSAGSTFELPLRFRR